MLEPDQNLPAEATILGPVINAVKANVSNFEVIFRTLPAMKKYWMSPMIRVTP
jgi:hypothetical protein